MIGITSYLVFFLCVVLVLSVLTLGLNLQWGFTGLFNAGVAGFYAIGGYTHAILTAAPQPQYLGNFGLPWIVGIAGAMALTALAALLIGLLTIRLRGDFLAIATFGIAILIQLVALNLEPRTARTCTSAACSPRTARASRTRPRSGSRGSH
jgi:branched-chain amino acid transport system permease protein